MPDEEDIELKRLRMEKMQAILRQKKMAEQRAQRREPTLAEKIDQLINVLLAPDALQYLQYIKSQDIEVYNKIRQYLFPPKLIQEIDLLMAYLYRGMIRRHIISKTEIQYLERKARGIDSQIRIKKQGEELTTLSNYLKEEE
ncbi:MAG: hypothetical protein DRO88_13430 [Promethearchaeia archaeon]|nr:MAG: hypothetical protein DRO88_13430 [Candidatus Lokiarchaeia archaeon]